jgi:hypothetical protein
MQEESVYDAVSDSESEKSATSSDDQNSILEEKEDEDEDDGDCEVQSQFIFEHDFAKIDFDIDYIKETFGKQRNGGRVTPRNLYINDLIL